MSNKDEGLLNLIRALMDRLDRHMGDTDLDDPDPHDPDLQVMQWAAAVLESHKKREPETPKTPETGDSLVRVTLNLPKKQAAKVEYLSLDWSVTKTQVIIDAINAVSYLNEVVANKGKVLVQRNGTQEPNEVLFPWSPTP